MELLTGQTLRERLTSGLLRVHETLDIGIQVADALDSAHARGVIHRDIKPANLFLNERGQIKILDFGLAKLLTRPSTSLSTTGQTANLTRTGVTLGTVAYMSPEQVTGERLDGRTDLFSFGVVLYECVTGHQPFNGKTSGVVFSEILNRTPAAPMLFNPELPPRLQELIATCLEKDRELRYQHAADLRADLKRLKRDLESTSQAGISRMDTRISVPSISSPGSQSDAADKSSLPQIPQPGTARGAKRGWIFGVVAVLIAFVVATLYFLQPRQPASVESQSVPAQPPTVSVQPPSAPAVPSPADNRPAEDDAARARSARIDAAAANARARLAAGDINGAVLALEAARAIDPAAPAVLELTRLVNQFRTQAEAARRAAELPRQAPTPPLPPRQATRGSPPPEGQAAGAPPQAAAPPPSTPAPEAPVPAPSATPPVAAPAPVEPTPRPTPPPPAPEAPLARREPTPAPAAPANGDDEAAIRRVLATYARAIETKDLALFRSVKPNLSSAEQRRIEDGFRAVSSQRVNITILSIDRRDAEASVRLRRRDSIDAGGRQQTTESQQTMTLIRTGAGWVIGEIGR